MGKHPLIKVFGAVALVVVGIFFLVDTFEEYGSTGGLLIVGAVALIVGTVIGYQSLEKKQRITVLGAQRPGAVVIDGVTPQYMTLLPSATEKELRTAKSKPRGATLAITPDAVELWVNKENPTLVRSIPNTEDVMVHAEVVHFGRVGASQYAPATSFDYESLIITDREGSEIILHTRKIGEALRQVKAALNRETAGGQAS